MQRCWLKGALGDALHVLSCASGYNIRWLMRAITAQGAKDAKAFVFALPGLSLWSRIGVRGLVGALKPDLGMRSVHWQRWRGSRIKHLAWSGSPGLA
jgi:hypothetical protein